MRLLGWEPDVNLRLEYPWATGDVELMRRYADELVTLNSRVLIATSTPVTIAPSATQPMECFRGQVEPEHNVS